MQSFFWKCHHSMIADWLPTVVCLESRSKLKAISGLLEHKNILWFPRDADLKMIRKKKKFHRMSVRFSASSYVRRWREKWKQHKHLLGKKDSSPHPLVSNSLWPWAQSFPQTVIRFCLKNVLLSRQETNEWIRMISSEFSKDPKWM